MLGRSRLWLIPAIGAFTPLGLLVVEASAFVMRYLGVFRLVITAMALTSGLFLNGWVLMQMYRGFRRRWPAHRLSQDDSREVLLVTAIAVTLIVSLLAAYFCYKGLEHPDRLPNWEIFVSALIALVGPFLLNAFFSRRALARR